MGTTVITIAKAAVVLLSDERGRKLVGGVLIAILSPLILLITLLCCLGSGAAEHNNRMVDYLFFGAIYDGEIPAEFETQVTAMKSSFSSLDSAVATVNALAETSGLDPTQVKAAYYVLCSEGGTDAVSFIDCFYTLEERTRTVSTTDEEGNEVEDEETYTVAIPNSLSVTYQSLGALLGREVTPEEQNNIQEVYTKVAGSGGEGYEGSYIRGDDPSVELNVSGFTDPSTKNAQDLVAYC